MSSQLVIVQTVYYHPGNDNPINIDDRYCRELASSEAPYIRKMSVGQDWKPLDLGWLDGKTIKQICIASEVGKGLQVIPTPAEQAEINATIIEIGSNGIAQWQIAPGETFRGQPADPSKLQVRCLRSTGVISLVLIPS